MRCGIVLAITLAVAGCMPATSLPTEDEARSLLDEAVSLVDAGRIDELCDLGGGNCARLLREAGDPPLDAPTVVGTRVLPERTDGEVTTVGGIILELCGASEDGPYYTEMLVFRDAGTLRAIEPVYWSGFEIAIDGTTDSPPTNAGARCAASAS